jgi:hypothetical protein
MGISSVIQIRKLAAVDIAFLGARFILAEFILGAVGPVSLGLLTLVRSRSIGGTLFGAYVVSLGVNYVPLLWHAVSIARHGTAHEEIADEADDREQLLRRYRRQSLFLLLPLVVPIAALVQGWRTKRTPMWQRGFEARPEHQASFAASRYQRHQRRSRAVVFDYCEKGAITMEYLLLVDEGERRFAGLSEEAFNGELAAIKRLERSSETPFVEAMRFNPLAQQRRCAFVTENA